jgi:hypothetical protein
VFKTKGRHTKGAQMSEAAEYRSVVHNIALDVNSQLTVATQLKVDLADLGERLLALSTHNLDMAKAGAILTRSVEDDFRALTNKIILVHKILEDYVERL